MTCDGPHWGKYRGTVITSADPLFAGRLLCAVERFPGMVFNWAAPCVPYAGVEQGFFAMPPTGANVWIEFENGDLDYPIWSGCFWGEGEIPIAPELGPLSAALVKTFRTPFCTVQLDDTPEVGGITIRLEDPAVPPVVLSMNATGLTIQTGPATVNVNAETGVSVNVADTEVIASEAEITLEAPAVSVTAEAEVGVECANANVTGDVDVTGALVVEGPAQMAPSVTIEGALDVSAETTILGDLNLTGPLVMEGAAQVAGSLLVEGVTSAAGFFGVEGDCNVAGVLTVEGDEAVAGVIEGVVVPPLL